MDLHDFQAEQLYFEEPLTPQAGALIEQAAELYGEPEAEQRLLKAYELAPEHPLVLVALYRFFYYQHRLQDALRIAERTLVIAARSLGLPEDWRLLDRTLLQGAADASVTRLRFYMLALKGAGYLELRLGKHDSALHRLQQVTLLDDHDRLGAQALIDVFRASIDEHPVVPALHGSAP